MYPVCDEVQERKESVSIKKRLSPSRPAPEGTEKGREANATKNEEEDLRIMQHFVRDFIERSGNTDPL